MTLEVTRQNHYVPIWYQKSFILKIKLPDGRVKVVLDLVPRAPKSCFLELDLYTTRFGSIVNDEIERCLFGKIDDDGARHLFRILGDCAARLYRFWGGVVERLRASEWYLLDPRLVRFKFRPLLADSNGTHPKGQFGRSADFGDFGPP